IQPHMSSPPSAQAEAITPTLRAFEKLYNRTHMSHWFVISPQSSKGLSGFVGHYFRALAQPCTRETNAVTEHPSAPALAHNLFRLKPLRSVGGSALSPLSRPTAIGWG